MSGIGSTGMKLIGQLEEAFEALQRRVGIIEGAAGDALTGVAEASAGVRASLDLIGVLEERIDALEERVAVLEALNGGEDPEDPEDPEEPEEPEEPEGPTYLTFLPTADDKAFRSGPGYVQAIGQQDAEVVSMIDIPRGEYDMWARVYGKDQDSDAMVITIGTKFWRLFPRVWGEWQVIPVGTLTVEDDEPERVTLTVAERGAALGGMLISNETLTQEQAEALFGPDPAIPGQPGEEPPVEPEPPSGTLSDGIFRVAPRVSQHFDEDDPKLRNGRRMTAQERRYHDAFRAAFLNPNATEYTAPRKVLNTGNSYHLGRHGEVMQEPALQVMARTGDGHILDELVRGWRLAYDQLVIEWDAKTATMKDESYSYVVNNAGASIKNGKWVFKDSRRPWSPHKKWLYHWGSPSGGRGTDLNNLQTLKPWGILARFLWVLEANRNAKSPAGFDYGAEADRWKPALRGFIDAYTSDTGADWEDNYRGLDSKWTGRSGRIRAKPGEWPFFIRTEGHVIFNAMLLCYYCGLLGSYGWDIPNHLEAFKGADAVAQRIRETLVETKDSKGRPSLLLPQGNTIMKATYTAYPAWELAHIRDIGRWDHIFDEETLLRLSRSYADMIKPDGSTLGDLAGEKDRTGHGYTVGHGSPRTPYQHAVNGFSTPMLWAETDYLFNTGTAAQTSTRDGGYGADGKLHIIPAAQFLRFARDG